MQLNSPLRGGVWVIPTCHIPISPHVLQARGWGPELRACVHVNTWGATEPLSCTFTTLWVGSGLLWCFGKGFLGAKHPPRLHSVLQQWETCSCHGAASPAVPLHRHEPCPCNEPVLSCPVSPSALRREGHHSQPILALHAPSCKGAQHFSPAPSAGVWQQHPPALPGPRDPLGCP